MPPAMDINENRGEGSAILRDDDVRDASVDDAGDRDAAPSGTGSDTSLSTLVPQRSRRRSVASGVGVVALLALTWWSVPMFMSSVTDTGIGSWSAVPASRQVVTTNIVQVTGWPSVRVDRVERAPGASVAGAWLVPAVQLDDSGNPNARYADGMAQLQALLPNATFDASTALPRSTSTEPRMTLVVLWDIIDCSALDTALDTSVAISTPTTRALGIQRRAELAVLSGPAFDLDTLVDNGICPAASVSG